MPTREAMHSLADEITSSYEARVAVLGSLRSDVSTQRRSTQALIQELDVTHRAAAQQLRVGLAKGHSDLAGGVAAQLTQLDGGHRAMTQELRAGLAKGHSDLAGGVADGLSRLDTARHAMTQELRSHLAEARSGLVQTEGSRKSRIRAWIHEVAATHAGARDAWHNLAVIMQGKRAAPSAAVGAPEPPYPAGGSPTSTVETMETSVEEAADHGDEDGSLALLADRAFAYLADHPDGVRLTDLEQELELGRFQINRVVRRLTDRGKVEKRDLLYFAI